MVIVVGGMTIGMILILAEFRKLIKVTPTCISTVIINHYVLKLDFLFHYRGYHSQVNILNGELLIVPNIHGFVGSYFCV